MSDRKIAIHISVSDDVYEEYRKALKGTRFERNGMVNASKAISYHMESVIEEAKKEAILQQQVKNGEGQEEKLPSDILQTNEEYVIKLVNNISGVSNEEIIQYVPEASIIEHRNKFVKIANALRVVTEVKRRWEPNDEQKLIIREASFKERRGEKLTLVEKELLVLIRSR